MYDFFFHLPWWAPAGLVAAGIAVWVWGNNRVRTREKRIGVGIILLAGLLSLVSYLVDTPAETVDRLTRELVSAVVARDSTKTGALLHAEAIAFGWDRQDIIAGAKHYAERTGLTSARITSLRVESDGQDLVSYLSVWSDHTGGPELPTNFLTSQWQLIWADTGGQWQLIEIIPLQIANVPREQIQQRTSTAPFPPRRRVFPAGES